MSPQYGELRPTSSWDRSGSSRDPCKFQRVSRLGSVTARHLVVGISQTLRRWTEGVTCVRQGEPSRWALAHISSICFVIHIWCSILYHSDAAHNNNKTSAVAEMGDRLATIGMSRKWERLLWGAGSPQGPHLTQCGLGRGLPLYQVASWSIQPFGHNCRNATLFQVYAYGLFLSLA